MALSMDDRLMGEQAQCYISEDVDSEKPQPMVSQAIPDQSRPPPTQKSRAQTG